MSSIAPRPRLRRIILVPAAGVEPAQPKSTDFKSVVSTNSTKQANTHDSAYGNCQSFCGHSQVIDDRCEPKKNGWQESRIASRDPTQLVEWEPDENRNDEPDKF